MNTNTQKANGLKVKTNVKAGGWRINHNETMAVDEPNVITDLEAVNAEEIKGGPRLVITKAGSLTDEEGLSDLEPKGDVVGGAKVGVGHLILPTANTYTGTTTVSAGTLKQGTQVPTGTVSF